MILIAISWLWAALVLAAFVGLTLVVMAIMGFAVRRTNPGAIIPPSEDDRPLDVSRDSMAGKAVDEHEGWTVAGVAPDQITAEMWVDGLRNAGIPAQIRASDTASYMGVTSMACRVLVPAERLEEAKELLEGGD